MKLADVSIRRPVLATVMVGALVVFGISMYPKIGIDLMPDVEFPVVMITALYPGADPESVESKIVDKIEEAVNTVSSIKMLRSVSMENVGFVIVQFELERDADQAIQDVRDKVSSVLKDLPSDLEPPLIDKFDINATPILGLALSGKRSIAELTAIADEGIKQKLQTIAGVGGVDIVGGQEREFKVWVNPDRLASYGLTASDVVNALRSQNMDVPGGRIESGSRELMVKTYGQLHSVEELGKLIITSTGGAPLRISDVARVEDGQVEKRSHSELNGESAIALLVRKQSGANTVEVAHQVKERLDLIRGQLPAGLTLAMPNDGSAFIEEAIRGVQEDLILGGALAILIILFFMRDWRATFISALALPTSVIATIAFIKLFGFTFNVISMLALSLSIGMLIDDAIVVIENVHRHLEMGKTPLQAASEGVAEIGLAVMATTASIVAVFLPVATMQGIAGRFFLQFGVTVAVAVSISLFVAFTLTPMLSSRMLKVHAASGRREGVVSRAIGGLLDGITRGYAVLLRAALRNRALTVLMAVVVFAGSLALVRFVPTEFMPMEDRGQLKLLIEMPTGTSLAATQRYFAQASERIRRIPGVMETFSTIGGGSQGEVNKGEIQVNLVDRKKRSFSQEEAMSYVRDLFASDRDVKVAVEPMFAMGAASGSRASTVQFQLRGRDYAELDRAGKEIIAELQKKGGYVDLDTSYRGGKPEVTVRIDRDRAADLGVPVAMIATTLRTFFSGEKASEILADNERHDVLVQLDQAYRRSAADISRLKVRSVTGALVPLSNIATIGTGEGPALIERQNRERQVTILANLDGKALGTATKEVEAAAKKLVPAGMTTGWGGTADIMKETFQSMLAALALAIILVYLILAAQFESFLHPLTIMISLPLSLIGAIGGLLVTGQTLSMMSMIGVIMLMGLVTKNAILLVDYTNTLRAQGAPRFDALLQAGQVRLRPILMTTMAMILGMLPVALALSAGGEQRAPMAAAVIGGLVTSTLLTLVVVPVAYLLVDELKDRVLRVLRRPRAEQQEQESAAGAVPATRGAASR